MKNKTKRVAMCGMMAALAVVVMVLGAALGLGIYLSPMLAGLCLMPIGSAYGRKYHAVVWLAVSALSFMLVPDIEENLMFLCLFGCYPLVRPAFQKLPRVVRFVVKVVYFAAVFGLLELLVVLVLVPEPMGAGLWVALIALAVVTCMVYDFVLPRMELLLQKRIGKLLK